MGGGSRRPTSTTSAWCPWNLISLSKRSHEAMHDRVTHKLTPLGESWRRRVSPPVFPPDSAPFA